MIGEYTSFTPPESYKPVKRLTAWLSELSEREKRDIHRSSHHATSDGTVLYEGQLLEYKTSSVASGIAY
jgi:hypothetical protein